MHINFSNFSSENERYSPSTHQPSYRYMGDGNQPLTQREFELMRREDIKHLAWKRKQKEKEESRDNNRAMNTGFRIGERAIKSYGLPYLFS